MIKIQVHGISIFTLCFLLRQLDSFLPAIPFVAVTCDNGGGFFLPFNPTDLYDNL
jgi:hypothetical protein